MSRGKLDVIDRAEPPIGFVERDVERGESHLVCDGISHDRRDRGTARFGQGA